MKSSLGEGPSPRPGSAKLGTIWSAKTVGTEPSTPSSSEGALASVPSSVPETVPEAVPIGQGTADFDGSGEAVSAVTSAVTSASDQSERATERGKTKWRGGERLLQYVTPRCEPSVVMGRHLNDKGMPKQARVLASLFQSGVTCDCTGPRAAS
jgi:hypothetical protein